MRNTYSSTYQDIAFQNLKRCYDGMDGFKPPLKSKHLYTASRALQGPKYLPCHHRHAEANSGLHVSARLV
eukprot:4255707-Prymnesium_polylepis.1